MIPTRPRLFLPEIQRRFCRDQSSEKQNGSFYVCTSHTSPGGESVLTVVVCDGCLLSQGHWLSVDICCQGEVIARQEGQREGGWERGRGQRTPSSTTAHLKIKAHIIIYKFTCLSDSEHIHYLYIHDVQDTEAFFEPPHLGSDFMGVSPTEPASRSLRPSCMSPPPTTAQE